MNKKNWRNPTNNDNVKRFLNTYYIQAVVIEENDFLYYIYKGIKRRIYEQEAKDRIKE